MSWRHKGIEINVTSDGIFKAHIDDLEVIADSRANCEKKIDDAVRIGLRRTVSLAVVGLLEFTDHYGSKKDKREGEIFHAILTGVNRSTRALQIDEVPKGFELARTIPDTPENVELLERWKLASAELREVNRKLGDCFLKPSGYGRIEAGDYEKVLSAIEETYI
jgi:hypothetical protein